MNERKTSPYETVWRHLRFKRHCKIFILLQQKRSIKLHSQQLFQLHTAYMCTEIVLWQHLWRAVMCRKGQWKGIIVRLGHCLIFRLNWKGLYIIYIHTYIGLYVTNKGFATVWKTGDWFPIIPSIGPDLLGRPLYIQSNIYRKFSTKKQMEFEAEYSPQSSIEGVRGPLPQQPLFTYKSWVFRHKKVRHLRLLQRCVFRLRVHEW
jgi:hypothetical protein